MKILAIETSCDETACAIVENGHKVLANVIASQIDLHAKTGGVVPEVAAREHVLKIMPVISEALQNAGLNWDDIDAIAVTKGPGLISSLIIGTTSASTISFVKNKILIPVQHITGHIYSNWLESDSEIKFPIVVLTVSGGHNELVYIPAHHEFKILGETLDDASGEAFDKVARILGLGYPGGPVVSKAALNGDPKRFKLPLVYMGKDNLDFSFSGLKTAVLTVVKKYVKEKGLIDETKVDAQFKNDLAASFQEVITEVLADKLILALQKTGAKEIHLAGGVSANLRLREKITEKLKFRNQQKTQGSFQDVIFRHPKSIHFCTDNAAMIAASAYFLYQKNPASFKRKQNIIPSSEFAIV